MFLTINFLTRQILGIVEYHIETKRIFSHDDIHFTSLRRHCLQANNLENFMFLNKNCPNDAKIECKFPSNLVELIKTKLKLEKFEA
jgi:hypothetical protein